MGPCDSEGGVLLTIGAAIVVLGVLIMVHELGHFLAAKAVGIGVPRFSIGLGPRTPLSFRRGETEYVISWVPFGGYVKMASKEEQEEGVMGALEGGAAEAPFPPHKLFENKPLWARIVVISAGVLMNAVFAYVVYVGLAASYGRLEDPTTTIAEVDTTALPATASALARVPPKTRIARLNGQPVGSWNDIVNRISDPTSERLRFDFAGETEPVILALDGYAMEDRMAVLRALVPYWEARVGGVQPGSAADRAGFRERDLVVGVQEDTVRSWSEMVAVVRASAGDTLHFRVLRDGEIVTLSAIPTVQLVPDTVAGERREVGLLGVERELRRVELGLGGSVAEGFRRVRTDAGLIWFFLRGLVLGRLSPRELGGPVLIGQLSGQFARAGLDAFLSFMALFSINLAILNLLPIPVLDGGHLLFLLVEGVRGKPISLTLRLRLTQFGLAILLGIMVLALTNDLLRVLGR